MPRSLKWRDYIVDKYRNHPEDIVPSLNISLEENDGTFLSVLRNAACAKFGGVGQAAEKMNLPRSMMYSALKANGNPTLSTLRQVLDSMGLSLQIVEKIKTTAVQHERKVGQKNPARKPAGRRKGQSRGQSGAKALSTKL